MNIQFDFGTLSYQFINEIEKGKSRFFNKKQIEKIAQINNLLKNNDNISLAYEIASKRNYRGQSRSAFNNSTNPDSKY